MGCGGERDRTKRPAMAAIAAKYSDLAVFTSDNPRGESVDRILADMKCESFPNAAVFENRYFAIKHTIKVAQNSDIIIIAGKGNEDYQMIQHHKGAIDMAKNLLNNGGENEEVVQIAKDIIKNQTISIASMESLMKTLIENLTQDKVREEKYLKEYEKIVKEMMCGLENLKPTGNVDKDFLQSMIVHHQGAIDMVNSIIKYTDNAEIKKMAEGELQNQQPEIDNMKKLFDSIK